MIQLVIVNEVKIENEIDLKFKYKVGGIKMLDKIAMITFLVIYIIFLIITIFMYLVIVGVSKCKTEEERRFEDEEQMNYLRNYKNGGKTKNE